MAKQVPWLTSNELIESIKRKIALPISQKTFLSSEILKMASEELLVSQVPDILEYHQNYFTAHIVIPLEANRDHYPIPERAIGGKLKDIFWSDNANIPGKNYGNLSEMTNISDGDKAHFNQSGAGSANLHKFYLEGNDIVVASMPTNSSQGKLVMFYYLRPNQLVLNDRAAIIASFGQTITLDPANLVAGDSFVYNDVVYEAVAAAPTGTQFLIGLTATLTAGSLSTVLNANAVSSVSSVNVVTITTSTLNFTLTTGSATITIPSTVRVNFTSLAATYYNSDTQQTEPLFVSGELVDLLQTKSGHRTYAYDVTLVSAVGNTGLFTKTDLPTNIIVGDYICLTHECIIPQIPTDLHSGLAERTSARILASQGDKEGLQVSNAKIQDIMKGESRMLDNRVENAPKKILNRNGLLRIGKSTRRY